MGNLGETSLGCAYSKLDILSKADDTCGLLAVREEPESLIPRRRQKLGLSCGANSLITEINELGMSLKKDFDNKTTDPSQICKNIESSPLRVHTWNIRMDRYSIHMCGLKHPLWGDRH